MTFVSVTRLRARSLRFVPRIGLHTWRSRRQLKGAAGFVSGYLASGPRWTFWTVTVWADEAAMSAFRNAGAHLKAMPSLIDACDEAAVVHWESESSSVPAPEEAAHRLLAGRISKLRHPSVEHASGGTWPDRKVPFRGPLLTP
jgi:hypothetical protein